MPSSSPRLQNLFLAVSVLVSSYILVWVVPSQIDRQDSPEGIPLSPSEERFLFGKISPLAALSSFIQIKASGEETSLTDADSLKAFLDAREDFEKRLVSPFSQTDAPLVHYSFPVPKGIQGMVDYWIHVFGRYQKNQFIFSHKDDVSLIYAILDLSDIDSKIAGLTPQELAAYKQRLISREKARIGQNLLLLKEKLATREPLAGDEQRLIQLLTHSNRISFGEAAKPENMRVQEGFAHQFRQAMVLSGEYMDAMERIFAAKGLPVELTRLVFVESAFNTEALSPAGARGLWQFIGSTGKNYLKIDEIADERLDPILSTYAAAEHLKNDYAKLGSWALAINAYNTGTGRMLKAKNELKTDDISVIIRRFEEPGYQFFSRNYYPQFLAALYVYDNAEVYFEKIKKLPPVSFDFFMPRWPVNLETLAQRLDIPPDVMAELNPALESEVLEGEKPLPGGYIVKVPFGLGRQFDFASLELKQEEGSELALQPIEDEIN